MIKIEESYELFFDTLSRLKNENLELNDEDLSYEIFEELDSDSHTFLHEWTVDRLILGDLLPSALKQRILSLRESIRLVIESKPKVSFYRNDSEWKKVRDEGNSILNIINSGKNNG